MSHNIEIERRFLMKSLPSDLRLDWGVNIEQGYLSFDPERTVHVRTISESPNGGCRATIGIKGSQTNATRAEFEIDFEKAVEMLQSDLVIQPVLRKQRVIWLDAAKHRWEINLHSFLFNLNIAEIELESPDQEIDPPDWVGEEVTEEPLFFASALVMMYRSLDVDTQKELVAMSPQDTPDKLRQLLLESTVPELAALKMSSPIFNAVEVPIQLYGVGNTQTPECISDNCPCWSDCAQHCTAGDNRMEEGFTPDLRFNGEKWTCPQRESGKSGLLILNNGKLQHGGDLF